MGSLVISIGHLGSIIITKVELIMFTTIISQTLHLILNNSFICEVLYSKQLCCDILRLLYLSRILLLGYGNDPKSLYCIYGNHCFLEKG